MRAEKVTFYVYADNEEQVHKLEDALYRFVSTQYERGVLVTAEKMTNLLNRYGKGLLISQLLN